MTHKYNTQAKKEAVVSNQALAKAEENIISTINCLKEEIINLKDIAIKRLQEKKQAKRKMQYPMNPQLMHQSSMTGETILLFQESQGIFLRDLEETVISVLSDIEANFSANDVEL